MELATTPDITIRPPDTCTWDVTESIEEMRTLAAKYAVETTESVEDSTKVEANVAPPEAVTCEARDRVEEKIAPLVTCKPPLPVIKLVKVAVLLPTIADVTESAAEIVTALRTNMPPEKVASEVTVRVLDNPTPLAMETVPENVAAVEKTDCKADAC